MMTASWPTWATEPVAISPPQPDWAEQAETLRASLVGQLAPWHLIEIHHVGSTAVPGLSAKPILDLMAGIDNLAQAELIAQTMEPYGWHYVPPELDQRPWRRFFIHVVANRRHAHLHLMNPGNPRWQQQLSFRDRLRDDLELRTRYDELKQQLAQAHRDDREAYSQAKTAFITKVIGGLSQ